MHYKSIALSLRARVAKLTRCCNQPGLGAEESKAGYHVVMKCSRHASRKTVQPISPEQARPQNCEVRIKVGMDHQ